MEMRPPNSAVRKRTARARDQKATERARGMAIRTPSMTGTKRNPMAQIMPIMKPTVSRWSVASPRRPCAGSPASLDIASTSLPIAASPVQANANRKNRASIRSR